MIAKVPSYNTSSFQKKKNSHRKEMGAKNTTTTTMWDQPKTKYMPTILYLKMLP